MPMKPTDPILGPPRGDAATVLAYLANADETDKQYVETVYAKAGAFGLDPAVVVAQWLEETDDANSPRWLNDRNPAGIGIPTAGTAQPFPIADGAAAAMLHLACLAMLAGTTGSGVQLSKDAAAWVTTVWSKHCAEAGVVRTIAQLCRRYTASSGFAAATWAWDPNYAQAVCDRGNAAFGASLPDAGGVPPVVTPAPAPAPEPAPAPALNMAKGLIPFPAFTDSLVLDSETDAYDLLGQRSVCAFVFHRMLGTLNGTDAYFHNHAPGLTDFGQDSESGAVLRWNDPDGSGYPGVSPNRTPWASGPYNANGDAYGDGVKLAERFGINGVNRNALSWEISGSYTDPWSDAAIAVCAQALAANAHDYGIAWHDFPYIPAEDRNFTVFHQEICGPKEKICPGPVVMGAIDAVIAAAKAIMQRAQTAGAPMPAPSPAPKPSPTPRPVVDGYVLPVGLTVQFLERAFAGNGLHKVTINGRTYGFNPGGTVSRAWLGMVLASIPRGAHYTAGRYPALVNVIPRGKAGASGTDFLFSDGSLIHKED